jgi:DNA-binding IclR family transcriptional regulator
VGSRSPKHVGAAGKLALAYADADEFARYCTNGLLPRTPYTITDPDALGEALMRIRHDGFADDNLESNLGIRALAAPVFNAEGRFIAAVSVPFIGDATPERTRAIRKEVLDSAEALMRSIEGHRP